MPIDVVILSQVESGSDLYKLSKNTFDVLVGKKHICIQLNHLQRRDEQISRNCVSLWQRTHVGDAPHEVGYQDPKSWAPILAFAPERKDPSDVIVFGNPAHVAPMQELHMYKEEYEGITWYFLTDAPIPAGAVANWITNGLEI